MNLLFERKLPIPMEIKEMCPLSQDMKQIIDARAKEIADIFEGKSDKLILIIGPCSADNEDSVIDYIERLRKVQEKVSDKIFIIPRIYTNKPRTTGDGYKGMLHQPNPNEKPDMLKGIMMIRDLHIRAIKETGFSCADEMLYPVMMNAIKAAQHKHTFIYRGWEVHSQGNPLAHAILRGYVNKHGQSLPNYHYEDLEFLCALYSESGLENPGVIIDTNHANSGKQPLQQTRIAKDVMHSARHDSSIKKLVKGFMIESYIEDGAQKIGECIYGKSITDPCLGWEKSEKLIYDLAELV